ncbi:TrbM/KikA/MpfK family conjugal transfer protein [Silicimonas sp. MF1-12-2]|uniref:TrbM/KikA/MpfK family conjugal transfer protein n=1 Tax=Silicimonas sp. MF1-12-2 TaxID=3384793 RepID=UPI0039B67004
MTRAHAHLTCFSGKERRAQDRVRRPLRVRTTTAGVLDLRLCPSRRQTRSHWSLRRNVRSAYRTCLAEFPNSAPSHWCRKWNRPHGYRTRRCRQCHWRFWFRTNLRNPCGAEFSR